MRTDLLTLLRTVRHLRLVQVSSRISMLIRRQLLARFRLLQRRYGSRILDDARVEPLPFPRWDGEVSSEAPDGSVFTFLDQSVDLGWPTNWQPETVDRLWHYQLHSFGFVEAWGRHLHDRNRDDDYRQFRELVEGWIQGCPIGSSPAWDPYPVSLRIRNWLRAVSSFASVLDTDVAFSRRLFDSLYTQASYLEHFVERHLLGNHLIENGRALLLAGLFFNSEDSRRWRRRGELILWRELENQFLADGSHDERSPMYHQLMLGVYRECTEILESLGEPIPAGVHERLDDMTRWLAAVHHPDGRIALLNDAVFGIAGSATPLLTHAEPPADGLTALAESGYFVFRNRSQGDFAIFDCGPLGPDHQPGHGHCDCLSFELSSAGERLIVDSGVGTYYGEPTWRQYYRSTRAHNTVQVDGKEQSEIWDRFRVGRRAVPRKVLWGSSEDADWSIGAHTGYERLRGKVSHRRWFVWIDCRFWLICDRVTGKGRHRVESFLHFHPEAKVSVPSPNGGLFEGTVSRGEAALALVTWGAEEVRALSGEKEELQGWYASDFNRHCANPVWAIQRESELPVWLGCLVSPALQQVTVRFESASDDLLQSEISVEGTDYVVSCREESVEVVKR